MPPDDHRDPRAGGDGRLDISAVSSRNDSTTLRTSRQTRGNSVTEIAMITFCIEARVSAISAMASRMPGIDINPSMTRMTMASTHTRKTGDQTKRGADDRGHRGDREADRQRHPRAPHHPRINIASQHIGAEPSSVPTATWCVWPAPAPPSGRACREQMRSRRSLKGTWHPVTPHGEPAARSTP